ncbi:MAG: S8/S53 family peptidase, partial [Mycobacteriales bacterium]
HTSPFSEYAWTGSGGGISNYEPAQPWQNGVVTPAPTASGGAGAVPVTPPCELVEGEAPNTGVVPCRAVPDVAAQSGDELSGFNIIVDGGSTTVLGTSLSAPLWQGMWARIQAAAPRNRQGVPAGLGFASPALYGLYRSPITDAGASPNPYTQSFYQITVGDNGPYPATPGWNYVTGLGTPNVSGLLQTLDHVPAAALRSGKGVLTDPSGRSAPANQGACRATPQIKAPPGSRANLYSGWTGASSNPFPADADVSLVSGNVAYSSASQVLTATIRVQQLAANPQADPGSIGDQFQALFTVDGTSYALIAARETVTAAGALNPTPQPLFELGLYAPGGVPTVISTAVQGTFNVASNTVTIRLPEASFAQAVKSQHIAATTIAGSQLSGLSVISAYDYGQDLQPAEQLWASCYYPAPGHQQQIEASSVGAAGTQSGGLSPVAGPPSCRPGQNQITGQPGQADSVAGLAATSPALSQEDLNILAGNLRWTGSAVIGTIKVQNLNAAPPNGLPSQEYFRYYFTSGGGWALIAERTATGTSFSVTSQSLSGAVANVTGSFDVATNTVTITMPDKALASIGGPKLASGDELAGMSILAQRDVGVLTLSADQQSANCVYTLG